VNLCVVLQSYRRNNDEAGPSNEIGDFVVLSGTTMYPGQTVVLVRSDLPNELFFIWFLVCVMGPFYLGRNWSCMFLYIQADERRHEEVQRGKG
jgi:hypothetical protein